MAFGSAGPTGVMQTGINNPAGGLLSPNLAQVGNFGAGTGPGGSPGAPNIGSVLGTQQNLNLGNFNTQLAAGRPNQVNPYGSTQWSQDPTTGRWTQNTTAGAGVQGAINPALTGAGAAASSFNPANNPTYGGPQTAGNLSFDPASVANNLYQSQIGLLEPGMQSQANALDQNLKAQGYDTNQAGGAQTAENNLMNQQNLVRSQAANWAAGQAIPQGAQALAAQESIPLTQEQVAQGAFGAGVTGAQLPISEASGLLSTALAPSSTLPNGAAQVPGLQGIDILGGAQQNFANQMSGFNAQQANQTNQLNGLLGLAGAGLTSYGANPNAWNNLASTVSGWF